MNRNNKILRHINKNGYGIEIGPSYNPVAPKEEGFKVHIIDHMSREQLIAKYEGHGVNLENIEEVDFVWQGESYANLTGKHKYYDWIIASHVIEHTPDIIAFINDCDAILKEDGVLSLVVPDKRYCFDHYRPITGISKIIDSHFNQATIHTPGTVAEHFLNVVSQSGRITWDSNTTGEYKLMDSIEKSWQIMNYVIDQNVYVDAHAWCFVPHSFRLMIHDLFHLGLIALQEVDFYPTEGCEFYITLGRKGKGTEQSRLEMLQNIEAELSKTNSGESIAFTPTSELEQVRNQLQTQLEETQTQLQQTQAELASSQNQLQQSQEMIQAMKTSKFWQLRTKWFKIKQALGLSTD